MLKFELEILQTATVDTRPKLGISRVQTGKCGQDLTLLRSSSVNGLQQNLGPFSTAVVNVLPCPHP